MTGRTVYLDHNASAPLLPQARQALVDALDLTGNPSSVHGAGRAVRALVDSGRDSVAEAAGARRRDVVFTGSATEALTQAIVGGAKTFEIDELVIDAGNHTAVTRAAEATGLPLTVIALNADGVIDIEQLSATAKRLSDAGSRGLFAVHWVNNETGVVQPLAAIEALIGPTPHVLVVDAVQAFGKLDLDFASRPTDMMAVSAHKIGGPAGTGALLMKPHCDDIRLIPGGGQEMKRRGGTEAFSLIAGFGAAAKTFHNAYIKAGPDGLIEDLEHRLREMAPDAMIFGDAAPRIGGVTNFAIPGISAATAMMALDLDGIAVSSGSACSSGKVGKSHVLAAMHVAPELSDCALRVSLGWNSRKQDVDAFLSAFEKIVARHRKVRGAA